MTPTPVPAEPVPATPEPRGHHRGRRGGRDTTTRAAEAGDRPSSVVDGVPIYDDGFDE